MDRLFLRHNSGQVVTVEGNTQVGRGRGERRDPPTWYTDRPKPPDFAELDLAIDIDGSPYMSRNHAGIRREGAHFTVQDLNSLNGTYCNGRKLAPGTRYLLSPADLISMGVDTFLVGETPETLADWDSGRDRTVRLASHRPEWYLGVAGFDPRGPARRVFYNSVVRVAHQLHRRGYHTEVRGIKPTDIPEGHSRVIEAIQRSEILETLAARGLAADGSAHTFLQYSGHGTPEGLIVNEGEVLTPHALLDVVGSIRGKKCLVIDACHAGVFLADPPRIPPQTAILVATRAEDGEAYAEAGHADPTVTDLPMTNLSRRLWGLLRDRQGTFDILNERAALEAEFPRNDDEMMYVQTPKMNTAAYTVCLRSSYIQAPVMPPPAPPARSATGSANR